MHTKKGYILPVILILLLLLLSGFFIFNQQIVESPVLEDEPTPVFVPKEIKIATSTFESLTSTSTEESPVEETDTSPSVTASSSINIQIEN